MKPKLRDISDDVYMSIKYTEIGETRQVKVPGVYEYIIRRDADSITLINAKNYRKISFIPTLLKQTSVARYIKAIY